MSCCMPKWAKHGDGYRVTLRDPHVEGDSPKPQAGQVIVEGPPLSEVLQGPQGLMLGVTICRDTCLNHVPSTGMLA